MSLRLLVTVHLQPSNETDFYIDNPKSTNPKLTIDFKKKTFLSKIKKKISPDGKRSLQPPKPSLEKLKHKNWDPSISSFVCSRASQPKSLRLAICKQPRKVNVGRLARKFTSREKSLNGKIYLKMYSISFFQSVIFHLRCQFFEGVLSVVVWGSDFLVGEGRGMFWIHALTTEQVVSRMKICRSVSMAEWGQRSVFVGQEPASKSLHTPN